MRLQQVQYLFQKINYNILRFVIFLIDICEDPEIKERIVQLRTEQESKRQAADRRKKVRKSSSNTRTQSVRRTSLRDKGLTQRRDAVEEARLRMQAEYKVISYIFKLKLFINFEK